MKNDDDPIEEAAEFTRPPFLYEIRVQGRLSAAQWTDWFDDLTVTNATGVSTLSGRAADHAALYGVLARLRDLAIPLVSVKVLDADAQRKLAQQSRRTDLLLDGILGAVYLLLLGGLAALTVFLAPIINTALALALLFGLLGGLAYAFWLWSGRAGWRWLSYGAWVAAGIAFTIFIPLSGWLPPALGIAVLLFILAAGLITLLALLRRHADALRARLPRAVPASDHPTVGQPAGAPRQVEDSESQDDGGGQFVVTTSVVRRGTRRLKSRLRTRASAGQPAADGSVDQAPPAAQG
jgi:hypothetical protein